jgi:hypothetical protein
VEGIAETAMSLPPQLWAQADAMLEGIKQKAQAEAITRGEQVTLALKPAEKTAA